MLLPSPRDTGPSSSSVLSLSHHSWPFLMSSHRPLSPGTYLVGPTPEGSVLDPRFPDRGHRFPCLGKTSVSSCRSLRATPRPLFQTVYHPYLRLLDEKFLGVRRAVPYSGGRDLLKIVPFWFRYRQSSPDSTGGVPPLSETPYTLVLGLNPSFTGSMSQGQ